MLKTLSTRSAKSSKGKVRVGSGGRNRAEPIGKDKVNKIDDGDGHSGNFDKKFHPLYNSRTTHLNAQDEFINGLIN